MLKGITILTQRYKTVLFVAKMPKKMKKLRSEQTLQFIQPCLDVHKLSNCDYGDMAIKQHTQK